VGRSIFLFLFSLIFIIAGCGGSAPKTSAKYSVKKYAYYDQSGNPADQDSIEDLIYSELSKRQQALLKRYTIPSGTHSLGGMKFDIPMTMNDRVRDWIDYFVNGSGRKHYARYLARSTRVVPTQLRILKEQKMPRDLIFLSMIESGFNTHAYSSAAAVGLWQFIRSTGRLYGLDNDYWTDERRDVEKSSLAAARHLRDLYEEFGDWYLAFAAYNAGSGKIRRAIDGTGSRDFWTIAESSYIRQETKDYVPKMLAAAIIGKNPDKYGFTDVDYQDSIAIETVTVPSSTDLDVVGKCAGVDADLIRLINPELLRNMTPPHSYVIKLPRGTRSTFEKSYARLDEDDRQRNVRYVARRGDTLRSIALDHGVSIASLANANPSLEGRKSVSSGTTVLIPRASEANSPISVASIPTSKGRRLVDLIAERDEGETKKKDKKTKKKPVIEEESGDGEMKVAWREKDSQAPVPPKTPLPEERKDSDPLAIVAANDKNPDGTTNALPTGTAGMGDSSNVDERIGQALAQVEADNPSGETDGGGVRVKPSYEEGESTPAKTAKGKKGVKIAYKVKRGESLQGIADKHDVTVAELKEWNRLGKRGLLANQKLVIYKPAPENKSGGGLPFIRSAHAEESPKASKSKIAAKASKPKIIAYKVRKGDTINAIARKYDVTPSQILALNGLSKKNTIRPGLVLKIPAKARG